MASSNQYIVVDSIKWFVWQSTDGVRHTQPLCPLHHLRMRPQPGSTYSTVSRKNITKSDSSATRLACAEGPHFYDLPRTFGAEKDYVVDRLDALVFSKTTFLYLDDVAIPVAADELRDKESPVWVKAKVTDSKSGLRLIIWAGNREAKSKAQLFVEPELKRLGFDQNDDHPLEVFAKVEAIFAGGVKTEISRDG